MADLKQVTEQVEAQEHAVEVEIYQPNGEPYLGPDGKTPCTISVLGSESKRYRQAENAAVRKMARAAARGQGRRGEVDPELVRQSSIDKAASVVVAFAGWEEDGHPMEFSPDNVRKLLAFDHIREQVEYGIARHADFSRTASSA